MKICFIAPADNYHTQKWCRWFSERGHRVYVLSFTKGEIENTTVHMISQDVSVGDSDAKKLKYLFHARRVKQLVDKISPDIINVHYATSYGTVAALSGIKNYVLSVWGADIYDFPRKTLLHEYMLRFSLKRASYIFSTSKAMAMETHRYTNKKIFVTPFGVDMHLFNPKLRDRSDDNDFVVGTIKALTPKYGIDYILKAAAIIRQKRPDISLKIRIAGKGSEEQVYRSLATKLELDDIITWLGFIPQEKVAYEWANMDVAIVYSTLDSESFGVSAVEAEACGVPVVIADIPGLMEATFPGKTSVVVQRKNSQLLADAIIKLYDDKKQRSSLASAGIQFVSKKYEINHCFEKIEKLFHCICSK